MSQSLNCVADVLLALLLIGTLVMALRLDRALRTVGRDRGAFEALIGSLGAATDAVKLGIEALSSEADRAAGQIERLSADADKMATDLSFLIEAADRAGVRLEQRFSAVPKVTAPQSRSVVAARDLRKGRRYSRLGRENPAEQTPRPSPVPADFAHSQQDSQVLLNETRADQAATDSAVDLRELAGITTKRRVSQHPFVEAAKQADNGSAATDSLSPELPRAHVAIQRVG